MVNCFYCRKATSNNQELTNAGYHVSCTNEHTRRENKNICVYCGDEPALTGHARGAKCDATRNVTFEGYPGT